MLVLRDWMTGLSALVLTAAMAMPAAAGGPSASEDEAGAVVGVETGADDGTMWSGGSPDFCEACDGAVVDEATDPGESEGVESGANPGEEGTASVQPIDRGVSAPNVRDEDDVSGPAFDGESFGGLSATAEGATTQGPRGAARANDRGASRDCVAGSGTAQAFFCRH